MSISLVTISKPKQPRAAATNNNIKNIEKALDANSQKAFDILKPSDINARREAWAKELNDAGIPVQARQLNPFLHQGTGSSIDPNRKRTAKSVYWNVRRYSRSVRAFVMEQFSGSKGSLLQRELFLLAESVDLLVSDAWARRDDAGRPRLGH